jgi:peptide subunit release factor 1 (eRF1)
LDGEEDVLCSRSLVVVIVNMNNQMELEKNILNQLPKKKQLVNKPKQNTNKNVLKLIKQELKKLKLVKKPPRPFHNLKKDCIN